jgi:hypothetical protein
MRVQALIALLVLSPVPVLADTPPVPPAWEEPDAEWPKAIEMSGGSLEIYQPQIEKFAGVTLAGRAAVAWTERDKAPVFGVVWITATVSVDRDTRRATVESAKIDKVRFPHITKDEEKKLASAIEADVPKWNMSLGLDAIQASLAVSQTEKKSSEGLRSTPPKMVFSEDPAVLLLYAGKPVEQPISGADLRRVVNTPMFVVLDPSARRYYLSGGKFWYESAAATGPFTPVAGPSPAVRKFYESQPPPPERTDAGAGQQAAEKAFEEPRTPPRIVVSTEPAELFVFEGPPKYVPVGEDADLLYAENTQRDVLVHVPTSETFVLASGRWFKARSLSGPWTAVRPDQLPAGFSRLPPDSAVGQVRTFVSGTEEAQDALADSQIPQTAAVKRDQRFEVTYDGEPRFKAIEGTPLAFAVNTPFSVIRDAGRYWACDQAVWYVAPGPRGPWAVSDRRPPDIDQVPPSAPVYNTKYVYVYQSTPEVVYTGYLPGYAGMYPYYGTVVYGTGFYYPPYIGPTVYYPHPWTYGFGVVYNPWVGFGFGVGFGSPFFYTGIHYGPAYGAGWYGPPGYRPYPPPYPGGWYRPPPGYRPPYPGYRPPPPGTYPGGRPPPPRPGGVNPPGARPPGASGWNNNIYARPANQRRNADRAQAIGTRPAPRPVKSPNNVYGDKQGNVYRQKDGGWERNTPQGWKPQAPAPSTRPAQAGSRPSGGQPGSAPQTRPAAPPQPQTRPAQPQQQQARPAARPASPPQQASRASPRPSYGNAPAGLGRDAAARQRSTPAPSRGTGGGQPGGRQPAGGHGGGGGR